MRPSMNLSLASLVFIGFTLGCNDAKPGVAAPEKPKDAASKPVDDIHDHPSHGPNGGDLIELGDEEYHAELVHDEKVDDVTIFILDSSAKHAVAIEAIEVIINLKHDGKPEQHKLVAEPTGSDAKGKSSRFIAKGNKDLSHAIEEEGADARLQLMIDGKSYSGTIEHDHEEGNDESQEHE